MHRKAITASLFGLALLGSLPAHADPHSDGISFGKGQLNSLGGKVTNTRPNDIPLYNDKPPQTSSFGGASLFDVGVGRINSCKTATTGPDGVANQECNAVNFLAKNPENKVKVPVSANDPILTGMRNTINNAKPPLVTDSGCIQKTSTTPDQHSTETCNEYLVTEDKMCTMGQVVQVDADSNYQCNITKNSTYTQTCDKILSVWCENSGQDGCDNGGIVPNSTQGDMRVYLGPVGGGTYDLQFGTFADNYWRGYGATFDRSLTFSIKDVASISQFTLVRAAFDDWLWVKVNGITVYVGPYGGDRAQVVTKTYDSTCNSFKGGPYPCTVTTTQVQYGPNSFGRPELNTSWNISLNIDLRPFLQNGSNVIWMRTIVAGEGEGAIDIYARMFCPPVCHDVWDNQCANLESRSQ